MATSGRFHKVLNKPKYTINTAPVVKAGNIHLRENKYDHDILRVCLTLSSRSALATKAQSRDSPYTSIRTEVHDSGSLCPSANRTLIDHGDSSEPS